MRAYIEDRYGVHYEVKPLTRKQTIIFSNKVRKLEKEKDNELETIEELSKYLIQSNFPEINDVAFDDMLDFNVETYGFQETYELLGAMVEEVFTSVGGEKKTHPYLAERKKEQNKEETPILQANQQTMMY